MKQATMLQLTFDMKLEQVTKDQQAHIKRTLQKMPMQNGVIIVDYVSAMITEINASKNHVKNLLKELIYFSKRMKHKPFKKITRAEILLYLESHRKDERTDPLHKGIGTYNLRKALIVKFYRWLFSPDVRAEDRVAVRHRYLRLFPGMPPAAFPVRLSTK